MEKKYLIYAVIGIIIIAVAMNNYKQPSSPSTTISIQNGQNITSNKITNAGSTNKDISIAVHYYYQGKEVFVNNNQFSIVNPPGIMIDNMSFTLNGQNSGNSKLNVNVLDSSNNQCTGNVCNVSLSTSSFSTTSNTIDIGINKNIFSTNNISTSQYDGKIVTFYITLNASNYNYPSDSSVVTINSGPISFTSSNRIITLTCSDNGGSGCASIKYCINTVDSCTPSTTYTAQFSVGSTNFVRYQSTDNAGNVEVVKSTQVI